MVAALDAGCRARAETDAGDPLAAAAVQGARVGAHRLPLLPQLGHLHPADLDADILQPGAPVSERADPEPQWRGRTFNDAEASMNLAYHCYVDH